MSLPIELGGKGNPRMWRHFVTQWEVGDPFDETTPSVSEYTVTVWDYTVTVPTRAQATQLLYAIRHISGRYDSAI